MVVWAAAARVAAQTWAAKPMLGETISRHWRTRARTGSYRSDVACHDPNRVHDTCHRRYNQRSESSQGRSMQHVRARQYGNVVRKRMWCALQVEVRGEWVSEWVGE